MLFDIFVIGLVMIMLGALVTVSMVYLELGPATRLAEKRHKLLAVALGSGILAFLIKLLIIITIAKFPQYTITPLLQTPEIAVQHAKVTGKPGPARYVWVALPEYRNRVLSVTAATRERYKWRALPKQAPSPAHNPTTPGKIALGKQLFFDKDLSRDGTLSCASCHDLYEHAGADGRATSIGID
jgi:cytochrome c peroxidase